MGVREALFLEEDICQQLQTFVKKRQITTHLEKKPAIRREILLDTNLFALHRRAQVVRKAQSKSFPLDIRHTFAEKEGKGMAEETLVRPWVTG